MRKDLERKINDMMIRVNPPQADPGYVILHAGGVYVDGQEMTYAEFDRRYPPSRLTKAYIVRFGEDINKLK